VLGEEKPKSSTPISLTPSRQLSLSKTMSKETHNNDSTKQLSTITNIKLYSPHFNNGNNEPRLNDTSKSRISFDTKPSTLPFLTRTFCNEDINNTKETDSNLNNALSNNKGACKSFSITNKTTMTNNTVNDNDNKLCNKNIEKDDFNLENKKSRNPKNKYFNSPMRKARMTEVFGKNNGKLNSSPDKSEFIHNHISHDINFHRPDFNIITCQNETMNKSQDCIINTEQDNIHVYS